ncbi:MAG: hypothetical protein OXG88_00035, partial [Gammaproteobacteria bacterium]|nr:hypothetical protein [Gammaproteobacteria bacterium]
MIEWLVGYGVGKALDIGIQVAKKHVSQWRKTGCLDEVTTHSQNHDFSHQIGNIDVVVSGLDHKLDAIFKEKSLPDSIRASIAEPNLTELSELIKAGQIQQALTCAQRNIDAIDAALKADPGPNNIYVETLRSHRQRLLFGAASLASWQGDIEAGLIFWFRARNLGPIDPEFHEQAVITLFNVGLKDEFRILVDQIDPESEVYRKIAAPCLAYLNEDWSTVDQLLNDVRSADKLLLRVEARLQIIDFHDVEAVKLTAELLDQTDDDTVLPVINLIRAQLTLDQLKRVITEYTPLEYDRRSLIDSLVDRINVALETTKPDSIFRAQALVCLSMATGL